MVLRPPGVRSNVIRRTSDAEADQVPARSASSSCTRREGCFSFSSRNRSALRNLLRSFFSKEANVSWKVCR